MTAEDNSERRREPRFDRVSLVHLVRRGEDGTTEELATGRTLNLSLLGIRLGLDHPLPLGAELDLTLQLDGDLVELSGLVVYQEAGDDPAQSVGIEFENLSAEARSRISTFLEHPPGAGKSPGPAPG